MALIQCPDCGKMVSDRSRECPGCGYPIYLLASENKKEKRCEYCGTMNPWHATHCSSCGAELPATESENKNSNGGGTDTSEEVNQENTTSNVSQSREKKQKFYEKAWFTILMLICFYPVGIFTMWRYELFSKRTRIIISVIFAFITVSGMFSSTTAQAMMLAVY